MTHDTDTGYWGLSKLPKSEIHDATIDCKWHTEDVEIMGKGTLVVKVAPDGRQAIQIIFAKSRGGCVAGEIAISIPPEFFDCIQKNPDQRKSDYKFCSKRVQ